MFLNNLPSDSAFQRSLAGDAGLWTTTDYLLASVVDFLAQANWQRGGGKGQRPKPIERPGTRKRIGTAMSIEELNRRLGR